MIRTTSLVLLALSCLSQTQALTCFENPTQDFCQDGLFYTDPMIQTDIQRVCENMPWLTGCGVKKRCLSGVASGKYCGSWNLLATVCFELQEQSSKGDMSGCNRYDALCPVGGTPKVPQCTDTAYEGIPNLLTTQAALTDVSIVCEAMPGMSQCADCTDTNVGKCPEPAMYLGDMCSDHYMTGCSLHWTAMCDDQPKGLEFLCGKPTSNAFASADGGQCRGVMRMYFHSGFDDYVLFQSWIPCNAGGYAFTFIVTVFAGLFNGFLKALRSRLEQEWMSQGSVYNPAVPRPGSFVGIRNLRLIPSTTRQAQHNIIRSLFMFVNATIDYALMLVAMTFNCGLFFATVLGLALGTLVFGHTVTPIHGLPNMEENLREVLLQRSDESKTLLNPSGSGSHPSGSGSHPSGSGSHPSGPSGSGLDQVNAAGLDRQTYILRPVPVQHLGRGPCLCPPGHPNSRQGDNSSPMYVQNANHNTASRQADQAAMMNVMAMHAISCDAGCCNSSAP